MGQALDTPSPPLVKDQVLRQVGLEDGTHELQARDKDRFPDFSIGNDQPGCLVL